MTMNDIAAILMDIRDNYIQINQMTETVNSGSGSRAIEKIIRKREQLVSEIKEHQKTLEQKHADWKTMCEKDPVLADLRSQIERLITAVLVLDTITQDTMSLMIEAMKKEVFSLTKKTKAAISYARHAL
jgi:hypothetical protein